MARHVYGYTKVWDGDSDPERLDQYSAPPQPGQPNYYPGQPQFAGPAGYAPTPTNPNVTYVNNV